MSSLQAKLEPFFEVFELHVGHLNVADRENRALAKAEGPLSQARCAGVLLGYPHGIAVEPCG